MQVVSNHITLPGWIRSLSVPAWVSTGSGVLFWINHQAEELLLTKQENCVGKPCHEVIRGYDFYCQSFCKPVCYWRKRVEEGRPLEPFVFQLGKPDGEGPWCHVLPIAWERKPGETWIVHCALDLSRAASLSKYLSKVASRTPHRELRTYKELQEILTKREMEVLSLMASDVTLYGIADKLHLSYATVRNHVQHVLSKLEAHDIQQAVAMYLLAWDRP